MTMREQKNTRKSRKIHKKKEGQETVKKFNKLFALLLAFAMMFSLVTPYVLAEEDAEVEDEEAEG